MVGVFVCLGPAKASHHLVTTGVFSMARHPMYVVFLYMTVAFALLSLDWLITAAWFCTFCLIFLPRLPQEEAILAHAFGQAYREYIRAVPPLGPGTHWISALYAPGTRWESWCVRGGTSVNRLQELS